MKVANETVYRAELDVLFVVLWNVMGWEGSHEDLFIYDETLALHRDQYPVDLQPIVDRCNQVLETWLRDVREAEYEQMYAAMRQNAHNFMQRLATEALSNAN